MKGDRGDKGIPGKAGTDGRTPYFHTAWADSEDGRTGFTVDDSADKTYIGTYTDYTEQDSRNPADYNWMRARGRDGRTTYTWIRYADDANGRGISNDPRGKTYIGLAYNKTTASESNNPSDYMWSLIKGEDGVDGARGADGQTLYTWIRYSANGSGNPMTQQPQSNTKYIGIAINKTTRTESNNYRDYTWSKYVGDDGERGPQGVPGRNGTDGSNAYVHIAYANSADGSEDFSLTDSNRSYIGTYTNNNSTASTNPASYKWTPFISDEMRRELDSKASQESLQDLEVHFAHYPTAEELALTSKEVAKQQGYINSLNNAITSNALDLESRLKIIEQNVGAGRLTIQAIATHFNFGEEGVVIGRENEQVRLRIINDKLEILDGNKVVATFGQSATHVSNLRVEGAFEFGNHIASKAEINSKKFTVISPNI